MRPGLGLADGRRTSLTRHQDRLALVVILLLASCVRAAYFFRAPIFIYEDSIGYFESGYELARGIGFDLPLRRTPGYPLFLAGSIWLMGEDLLGIVFVQHVLGILTAALVYLLGKGIFGWAAGLLAGLMVALSGPQLIYEHSLMAEAFFTFLLTLALWLLIRGLGTGTVWSVAGAGSALGLAAQARPIAAAVVPALCFALFLQPIGWRRRLAQAVLVTLGFAVIVAPTFVWNRIRANEVGPGVGSFLYDQLARRHYHYALPSPKSPAAPAADDRQAAARRALLNLMRDQRSRQAVDRRLRGELGLTEAEADRAMRDVALEIIGNQPARYVEALVRNSVEIMLGEVTVNRDYRLARREADSWRAIPSIAHALPDAAQRPPRDPGAASALAALFQPAQYRLTLGVMILLGLGWSVARPAYRPALVLALAALALVLAGAALVGDVLRYRYPADPMLAVLASGGLVATLAACLEAAHRSWRYAARRRLQPSPM
jgi:hypothetical protein